ncbi:MAG: EpsG family protein [Flavobacterium sp.]|nr:MAG: EpsG family protein [Flavobacterium sp.]
MENLIPLEYYSFVYYNALLATVLLVYFNTTINDFGSKKNGDFLPLLGWLFAAFVIVHIGLRPIDPAFVDMTMYAHMFNLFADGTNDVTAIEGDRGFNMFLLVTSKIMTVKTFFLVCALLYIVPLIIASFRWFKNLWFYGFLMLVISFSFLGYGVNGIRNGIATSLFILALSFWDRKVIMAALLVLSISFHKSMSLPIFALVATLFHNNVRTYLKGWIAAIPISLIVGNLFVTLFTTLGFDDARVNIYFNETAIDDPVSGFRWDFILYSATGVFAGWYFIVKKNFSDPLYARIVNIYLIANAFWILIIKAGFSNRFAYLSWFLLAVVITYPMIKVRILKDQHNVLGKIIVVYFMFTYLLNYILHA